MIKIGKFNNVLVNAALLNSKQQEVDSSKKDQKSTRQESNSEKLERENVEAIGGLRDPRRAVARNKHLQMVGSRIRKMLGTLPQW